MGGVKTYLAGTSGALVRAQRSIGRTSRGINPSRAGSIWPRRAPQAVPQSQSPVLSLGFRRACGAQTSASRARLAGGAAKLALLL